MLRLVSNWWNIDNDVTAMSLHNFNTLTHTLLALLICIRVTLTCGNKNAKSEKSGAAIAGPA